MKSDTTGWALLLIAGLQLSGLALGAAQGAEVGPKSGSVQAPGSGQAQREPVFFASQESFDSFYASFCAGKPTQGAFPARFSAMASGSGKQFVVYVDTNRIDKVEIQEDAHYTAERKKDPAGEIFQKIDHVDLGRCMAGHVAKPYSITLRLARSTLRLTALSRQSAVATTAVVVGPKAPFSPDNCASCHICGSDGAPLPELKARFCYKRATP
ncbi:MAG: hypothetical protein QM718_00920 [Steroidobacteraceae bacterium]